MIPGPVRVLDERRLTMTLQSFAIAAEKQASGPQMKRPTTARPAFQYIKVMCCLLWPSLASA